MVFNQILVIVRQVYQNNIRLARELGLNFVENIKRKEKVAKN